MLRNYFFVVHGLSVPHEITVLPLKKLGETKLGNPNILDDVFEKFVN